MALKDLCVAMVYFLVVSVQGLEFGPKPLESNVDSILVWIKNNDSGNIQYWRNETDKFLKLYLDTDSNGIEAENRVDCDYSKPPAEGKVCNVPVKKWNPCTSKNQYELDKSSPCIFLKLNDIINWKPETYNDTDVLPNEMPEDLKSYIKHLYGHPRTANTVWVSCEGENPADVENIGPMMYLPGRGFPGYFFPFTNTEGYLSPLVAVQFQRPARGIVINIECKAWAKNLPHDRHDSRGFVNFKLLLD